MICQHFIIMLSTKLIELTIPSSDNGEMFIETRRIDQIRRLLEGSKYKCLADYPLAKVYHHQDFQYSGPVILISTHADSVYTKYYASMRDNEVQGTFDNSASNAVAVEGMLNEIFPSQVLISFTGDEECDSQGVHQTIEILQAQNLFDRLELAIILDLTEAYYRSNHYTIENYFIEKHHNAYGLLKFRKSREFKAYLREILPGVTFVKDAKPDESLDYDEYDSNCFSFCLPCHPVGPDMHDNSGVTILYDSIVEYMNVLEKLCHTIQDRLLTKAKRKEGVF